MSLSIGDWSITDVYNNMYTWQRTSSRFIQPRLAHVPSNRARNPYHVQVCDLSDNVPEFSVTSISLMAPFKAKTTQKVKYILNKRPVNAVQENSWINCLRNYVTKWNGVKRSDSTPVCCDLTAVNDVTSVLFCSDIICFKVNLANTFKDP